MFPRDGLPVKQQEVFKPLGLLTTPRGERVIDFGQNLTGWVLFRVHGERGERVVLRHAETLDAQGNFYTENLRAARQTVEYILKGDGEEWYHPHLTFQGFRYVCVDAWPGELKATDFEAVAIYSDMLPAGTFNCSNPLVNQLISNVRWSMKDNFVDIPTDCPQRDERLGWTGDAQVFARAACYLMETAPFFRKWLRDVTVAQLPSGGIPHVVPDVFMGKRNSESDEGHSATGWGDVAVVAPWMMYLFFGDKELLAEQYPTMKGWVEYVRSHARDGLIWDSGFHFGDWVALDAEEGSYHGATPNSLCATAFYAYSAGLLSQAAEALDMDADVHAYRTLREDIAHAYASEFFAADGQLIARTQTAHILSLVFHLAPAEHMQRTVDGLVALLAEHGYHLTTGFLGTPHLCHALSENGRLDLAYELLLKTDYPSWLYQVTKGATTIWEHWDGLKPDGTMWSAAMNSFNHYAYGSVADWIFATIGGIQPDPQAPGFARALLRPQPGGGLDWAEASYESGYGSFRLRWEVKGGTMKVDINVPCNARAEFVLPGVTHACMLDGVAFQMSENGATAELGSGIYRFSYPYPL